MTDGDERVLFHASCEMIIMGEGGRVSETRTLACNVINRTKGDSL